MFLVKQSKMRELDLFKKEGGVNTKYCTQMRFVVQQLEHHHPCDAICFFFDSYFHLSSVTYFFVSIAFVEKTRALASYSCYSDFHCLLSFRFLQVGDINVRFTV